MTTSVTFSDGVAPEDNPNIKNAPAPVSAPAGPDAPAPAQEQTNERPAWLPEKFSTPEDFAKSYRELETKLGSANAPAPAPVSEQKVAETLQANGLDMAAYNAEFNRDGKLSEKSYAELDKAGLNRQFVDDYIRGQEAVAAQEIAAVHETVGGPAEFAKIQTWARANLSAGELADFNEIVDVAPVSVLKLAIGGLQARYVAANGQEPRLVNGDPGNSILAFRSRHEMVEAMSNPKYRKDPAYRADIEARLAVTDF
jgi:hypothetical protein